MSYADYPDMQIFRGRKSTVIIAFQSGHLTPKLLMASTRSPMTPKYTITILLVNHGSWLQFAKVFLCLYWQKQLSDLNLKQSQSVKEKSSQFTMPSITAKLNAKSCFFLSDKWYKQQNLLPVSESILLVCTTVK